MRGVEHCSFYAYSIITNKQGRENTWYALPAQETQKEVELRVGNNIYYGKTKVA